MGNTRRNNNRKYKKNTAANLVFIFVITLTIVVGLGIIAINIAKNRQDSLAADSDNALADINENYGHIMITKEAIPEIEADEDSEAAIEAAIEEITQENSAYADEISDEEFLEDNNIYVKGSEVADSDIVSMTFAGDILFDSNYAVMATLIQNGGNISSGIDESLLNIMRSSDIMMLNNEFPYSNSGEPLEEKQFTFRANPSTVSYLADMGVDVVSLANNHAYDYGERAFLDTLDTLNNANIPYVGAGHDIDEASKPVYFIINNIKIGILSATQIEKGDSPDTKGATENRAGVFRCWNNKALLNQIEETKKNCDFLVVYIHWGTESTNELDWAQEEQAPQIVNAGADLVIGDHPHVLQPIKIINGVPVIYSLGNFWFNSKEIDTCLFRVEVSKDGLHNMRFIPAIQSGCKTRAVSGDEALRIINDMRTISSNVNIDDNGYLNY